MYIKITKNQRGYAYYHLVEAYRKDGKVKQRTLMSLEELKIINWSNYPKRLVNILRQLTF